MKRKLWLGCKFLLPVALILYIAFLLLHMIERFWFNLILSRFEIFSQASAPWGLTAILSIFATLVLLFLMGNIVETKIFKQIFEYLVQKIPLLNLIWSEKDEGSAVPVIFQHPIKGEWKVGYLLGTQKMDDGKEFWRVFFVTGIGDHELIDKNHPELMIKLGNSHAEVGKLITSLMMHGPPTLKVLKEKI